MHYREIPIEECHEPMLPITGQHLAFYDPHPYAVLGAPYGGFSPWYLREGVLNQLRVAAIKLQEYKPGWKILLFDAWRPNAVQEFMVKHETDRLINEEGWSPSHLTVAQDQDIREKVLRILAVPSENPATPPPHSTGAAIDCTLADGQGREIDMGSPIDENSPRSDPDHFSGSADELDQAAHANRELLYAVMHDVGFHRHQREWWHFSCGDQMWAKTEQEITQNSATIARYGRCTHA